MGIGYQLAISDVMLRDAHVYPEKSEKFIICRIWISKYPFNYPSIWLLILFNVLVHKFFQNFYASYKNSVN